MVLVDVTLNVILGNVWCGANVTLAKMRRRTNVTPDPTNVTPAAGNVTPVSILSHPNVTLTPGRADHCAVSGESRGDVSGQTLASASRDAARRRRVMPGYAVASTGSASSPGVASRSACGRP